MLNEKPVPAAKVGERLRLHPARLQTIRAAFEFVPLLSDDVAADQISVVHSDALELSCSPGAYLLDEILNMGPEHRRRLEREGHIHPRQAVRRADIRLDDDMPSIVGGSSIAANLASGRMDRARRSCNQDRQ